MAMMSEERPNDESRNCHEIKINISAAVQIFADVRFDKLSEITRMNVRRVCLYRDFKLVSEIPLG